MLVLKPVFLKRRQFVSIRFACMEMQALCCHLENVDMDVRNGEHGSAHQHA